ncbi:MAG: type II toxin-antitoxin system RelE/ParE family toxin [Bacillota bacterium]
MYDVIFYEDPKGRRPVEEWLRQLAGEALRNKESRVLYNAISRTIDLLSTVGVRLGPPKVKIVYREEPRIWELRVKQVRIFFGQDGGQFILLHHIFKDAKKLDRKDIDVAISRMLDWLERFRGG